MSRFSHRVVHSGNVPVFLVEGFDFTGSRCWFLMRVRQPNRAAFEEALAQRDVTDLSAYGDIVRSGYGAPPADVGAQAS